jgi:carboxyl-terminal processing protease
MTKICAGSKIAAQTTMLAIVASMAALGCGTTQPVLPVAEPTTTISAPDPRLQPTFAPASVATPAARRDQRTVERREIVDAVWRTVRDQHYDPRLGGLDWDAVRRRYEPLALGAPSDEAFYRTLNDMIGELGQSHMMVTGPGAEEDAGPAPGPEDDATVTAPKPPAAPAAPAASTPAPAAGAPVLVTGIGDPGLTVRVIEGRPTVTAVRRGSSAARRHMAPGFIVTRIGGRSLSSSSSGASRRAMRPVEERFAVRRSALHLLQGPVGTKVTVDYLDNDDHAAQTILEREPPSGPVRQIGHLPPLQPEARISEIGGVGVIAFNLFLLDPLLPEIKQAMDRFRTTRVKGIILDLRGNPGGLGAMSIPVASEFVAIPTTLGTLQFRAFSQTFTAKPSLGRTPYTGPLVILTDEGTASASEILAGGLQEAGRARVVGDSTLGAVLPSIIQALPHGAVMQMVVADFKTPKGVLLEGRGVQPDRRVLETRAAFRAGHDPVMDAALTVLKAANQSNPR